MPTPDFGAVRVEGEEALRWRRAKSPSGEASFRRGSHVDQCDCFIFRGGDGNAVYISEFVLGGFVDFGNIINVCDVVDISDLVNVVDLILAIGGRKLRLRRQRWLVQDGRQRGLDHRQRNDDDDDHLFRRYDRGGDIPGQLAGQPGRSVRTDLQFARRSQLQRQREQRVGRKQRGLNGDQSLTPKGAVNAMPNPQRLLFAGRDFCAIFAGIKTG
jgi:hypothetical protein